MEQVFEIINQNVQYAPWIIFGLLLLAGFNLPVSEDGMLLISALLASQNPESSVPLFLGVFLGAYFSDLICFSLGYFLGPKIFEIKLFKKILTSERRDQLNHYYVNYGLITLIFGRFIPFGVRNGLFLSAGLSKMRPISFALADLLSCIISTSTYFYLYYTYGKAVIEYIKKGQYVIFALALAFVVYFVFQKLKKRKQNKLG